MDGSVVGLIIFSTILLLLASGIWVAPALIIGGGIALAMFSSVPVGSLMASTIWDASWHWPLTALPLFIWMGEILFRSSLSSDMFRGLSPWLSRLPGGLLHVNILGCGMMAAITGSSAVTAATIGRMSMRELDQRGYDPSLSIGTLAGSGTLGLLIPPSIMMIIYGVLAQQSISRLFIAGVLPGMLIIALFMIYVGIRALLNPKIAPVETTRLSFAQKMRMTGPLLPVIGLIFVVIGSIYGGYATPTEAATIGVLGAFVLSAASGSLTWRSCFEGLMSAVTMSCMITFILAPAFFLSIALGFVGVPAAIAAYVESLSLSPYMLIAILTVMYIVLGCFLEGASMMVLTAAVVIPLVTAAGFDLIWFGIFLIITIEMSQITPPVGMNLFVLQGLTGKDLGTVTRASMPFFGLMVLAIAIITVFPQFVLAPVSFITSR